MEMFKDFQHGMRSTKLAPSTFSNMKMNNPLKHVGNVARGSSIASFASVMRQSSSVMSILALAEEHTHASHPTKFIENSTLRIPAALDQHMLPPAMLQWAKSPRSQASTSSARLVQSTAGGLHATRLVVDNDERLVATAEDDPFIFLQLTDLVCSNVPQNCEVFYVISTADMSYASRSWPITEKASRNNEAFLLPYAADLKLNLFVRFPLVPSKKKGFISNIRKKNSAEHLQGAEIHLGEILIELAAADFGKEMATLRLNVDRRLESTLKWNFAFNPEVNINVGVWTGAVQRVQSQQNAAFAAYLTIQSNPKCPTWKRYWAVTNALEGNLQLFDFEYKDSKLHHTVPLASVSFVKPADPEEYPIANTFQMMCKVPRPTTESAESNWAASTDTLISVESCGWVCRADSDEEMSKWIDSLSSAARLARSMKVALPKRISD